MLKNKSVYVGTLLIGACLLVAAIVLYLSKGDELKAITGVCLGIGSGLIAMSVANLLAKRLERKYPERRRQTEVDYHDERNTFIRAKAMAKAGSITQWCVMGIAYITILIDVPLWVTLLIVGVFAFHSMLVLYFTGKYQQEM